MSPPPIPRTVERLLVICPSWVGDTVMATPVLRAARAALPAARITAAVRPGLDELLEGTPWLDDMLVATHRSLLGLPQMARRVRRPRPQATLLLPNSFRAAVVARLSGAPRRIGYDRFGRRPLLTDTPSFKRRSLPVATLEYYAALAEWALGMDRIDRRMELAVTDRQRSAAQRLLHGVPRPFVLLNPGANKPRKRWPARNFAAVADRLAETHGLAAVASGSAGDRGVLEALIGAATTTVHDLAARGVTLGSLKAVIREARLTITNDTGPRHMAAALGTPVVTLFGPTDPRWTTIGCPHEQILLADPFLPENLIADRHPDRCAINRIAVSDVLSAAEQLLAASGPPADEAREAGPAATPPSTGESP
ncbi:MAG: lipopolysaccharide heptosyltransferase II [Planctomycetota bacterium]|jgi:heptosyltransferase-2